MHSGIQGFPIGEDGKLSVELPATDDPALGAEFTYTIEAILFEGKWIYRDVRIPDGTITIDLTEAPTSSVTVYPTRAEWEALVNPVVEEARVIAGRAETAAAAAEFAAEEAEATIVAQGDWAGAVDLASLAARPNYLRARLTGNVTVTLPTPGPSRAFTVTLDLTQDSTGGRTLALPGVATAWAVGIVPHPDPASRSIIHLMWTGITWVGMMAATNIGIPAGGAI
ncbi:hypothetical protein [Flaviflexus equikiangi]|uniref:Uncharacterized protein n=1 Tax=Flaviflexus equikiangi TaxID=2758573 RepID=A0ABS2TCF5_9ACTO|nr:hypothetical protein [Flaviflexus equikiangi]MBM9432325.1 hypothetical protein [Flaviflexus equikiangi]